MTLTALELKIRDAAQKYYTDGSSDLTDAEFDALVDQLKQENPQSILFKTGWGYDIQSDSTPGEKVPHRYGEAGSLSKCRVWSEIHKSLRGPVRASLKLDGLSVVLYYAKGKLYQALTRGNGHIGIDITDKVIHILKNTQLSLPFSGAIRGEIFMKYSEFETFKAKHPEAKNPRNSTAGLINGNEITSDFCHLSIGVYSVVGDDSYYAGEGPYLVQSVQNFLAQEFEFVAPNEEVYLSEDTYLDTMSWLRDKWYNDIPADGIVITNNIAKFDVVTHYVEYVAQAFKFQAEFKETEVVDVEWNLSKSRYLVPKVKVSTVELSGTNVSYCTGYNAKYIADNNISPGAVVEVEKHGEIIPNINKVITPGHAKLPTQCPECHHDLTWNGVHLMCPNPNCGNANRQDLRIWIENIAPVDGLGDAIRTKFLEMMFGEDLSIEVVMEGARGNVTWFFVRSGHKKLFGDMITRLCGYDKSTILLSDALRALNIPRLGDKTADKLASHPKLVKRLLDSIKDCAVSVDELLFTGSVAELRNMVGAATTDSILSNLNKFSRLKLIEHRIIWDDSESIENKGKVAITGKLSVKRSEFEKELKAAGYTPAEISKDSKFLITDNPNSTSSKNKKADQWGIEKITESEFREKYL